MPVDYAGRAPDHPQVRVGGLPTARLSRADLAVQMIADCICARWTRGAKPKLIFTANGQSIARAAAHKGFALTLAKADLIHADDQPVVAAARWMTRTPIPERSATTDFIHDAAKAACAHGLRFYLLGGSDAINKAAAARLLQTYPGLVIAGRHNGYFCRAEEPAICDAINRAQADVIWVGLGVPREQEFCVRNRDVLSAGWLISCGGCLNVLAKDYARAPVWMQQRGLEWLHRVWRQPARLWLRYALTNPRAAIMLLIAIGPVVQGAVRDG